MVSQFGAKNNAKARKERNPIRLKRVGAKSLAQHMRKQTINTVSRRILLYLRICPLNRTNDVIS